MTRRVPVPHDRPVVLVPGTDGRTLALGGWDALREEAAAIRYEVFVDEQGVPADLEIDEEDPHCLHAVLRDAAGRALATGRLLPDGHIGRMAVRHKARGTGAGARVLLALVDAAVGRGHRLAVLSAQTHAVPFYKRYGFEVFGDEYDDCGIPHVEMRRALGPAVRT